MTLDRCARITGLIAMIGVMALVSPGRAQVKKSDAYVKAIAEAGPVDSSGKQVVSIKLAIDDGWHIYANPVGEETLEGAQTRVEFKGAKVIKVDYPPGKLVKDKEVGDHKIYEDTQVIKATVQRGAEGPLEVQVHILACTKSRCLQPAVIKLAVK